MRKWGTHNGSSRAFASVRANIVAEQRLADWLGVESTLIYPSVMLANLGAIPGLTGRHDAIAMDEMAHSSMQEAAKIARADGTKVATFAHSDPAALEQTLAALQPYRCALVCIDGVYSMSGKIPPMAELDAVARSASAVLYIDDAHGTGVLGEHGRGTVLEALGSYENAFVVGSLSKAFSCAGGFHRVPGVRFTGCSRFVPAPTFSAGRSCLAIWKPSARSSTSSARANMTPCARGWIDRSHG